MSVHKMLWLYFICVPVQLTERTAGICYGKNLACNFGFCAELCLQMTIFKRSRVAVVLYRLSELYYLACTIWTFIHETPYGWASAGLTLPPISLSCALRHRFKVQISRDVILPAHGVQKCKQMHMTVHTGEQQEHACVEGCGG